MLDDTQTVALKVLNDTSTGVNKQQLQQFEEEVNLLRACRFQNVVSFLGGRLEKVRQQLLTSDCQTLRCYAECIQNAGRRPTPFTRSGRHLQICYV